MEKKKSRKIMIILFMLFAISISITLVASLARYVSDVAWNYYLESQNFYFASSSLDNNTNLNNKWDGGPVFFDINNFNKADDISGHDIEYTLTCEVLGDDSINKECLLNGTGTSSNTGTLTKVEVCQNNLENGIDVTSFSKSECEDGGYTWVNGKTSTNNFFEVVYKSNGTAVDNVEVRITAKATSPFTKTITGDFILVNNPTDTKPIVILEHDTLNGYEKVIITNTSNENMIYVLKWDASKLRISKSDYLTHYLDSNGYINEIEFRIPANEIITFEFYKVNENDSINESNFTYHEKGISNSIFLENITLKNVEDAVEVKESSYTNDTLTLNTSLNSVASLITYEVTITNNTNKNYILKSIDETQTNSRLSFRLDGITYGTIIEFGTSKTFTISLSTLSNYQTGITNLKFNFTDAILIPEVETVLTGAKSTTDSYIKTGFFPSSESRIVLDFTFLGPRTGSTWLFSSRRAFLNQMFGIAWNQSESLLQFNNVSYNLGSTGYKSGQRYSADISKEALILNGVKYADPADTPWQGIFEFYMFANNEARTVRGHTNGQAVIHNLKIYQSGVLVLDANPVILDNGEVAYWNNVNGTVLETVGTLEAYYEVAP